MKRLVYLISTFLVLTGMYGGNVGAEHLTQRTRPVAANPKPHYPLLARNRGIEGRVVVNVSISAKGTVKTFSVGQSSGSDLLDKAAVQAVKKWRFHPVLHNGKAIPSSATVPIVFRLEHTPRDDEAPSTASSSGSKNSWVWCATDALAIEMWESSCRSRDGKAFSHRSQAEAEHKRLKAASSTASTSSSTVSIPSSFRSDEWVFCATALTVESIPHSWCVDRGGVSLRHAGDAYAEHNRLKAASSGSTTTASGSSSTGSTTTQTAQTTTTQPSTVDKSALDLEFWQSIKDQKNADMYRAYIDQFPDGVYVVLAKIKLKALGGDTSTVAQSSIPNLDYGRYHALVIGNDRYQHLKNLSTAVNDANAVASLLRSRYQFNVDVLTNATRDETVSALSRLRRTISSKDNLLIYYAGHGWLDKDMDEGFWLPVDAVDDDQVHWIANDTIMRSVRAMKAKHVMVVADSCFSGTLIRGIKIRERSPDYIKQIVQKKARTALTSGGLEPVTDVGGGNHSIFAATFMRILNENTGYWMVISYSPHFESR